MLKPRYVMGVDLARGRDCSAVFWMNLEMSVEQVRAAYSKRLKEMENESDRQESKSQGNQGS